MLELGTFYPFGTILTNQGEVKPVSVYLEVEDPDPNDIILYLHNTFEDKINNGISTFAVICIDVFVNQIINDQNVKRDAIELRTLNKNKVWNNYYIPYIITNENNIIFSELFLFD